MFIKPDYNLNSIFDINLEELKRSGIKIILSDLDSTIMPSKSGEFPDNVMNWIYKVRQDFDFAVISNNKKDEYINTVKSKCDFDVIGRANKPSCKVMREYLHKAHKVPYLKKDIPSHYNFSNNKIVNTNQRFKKYTNDCLEKYKETMKEFEKLGRKAKLKSRKIFKNLIKSYK